MWPAAAGSWVARKVHLGQLFQVPASTREDAEQAWQVMSLKAALDEGRDWRGMGLALGAAAGDAAGADMGEELAQQLDPEHEEQLRQMAMQELVHGLQLQLQVAAAAGGAGSGQEALTFGREGAEGPVALAEAGAETEAEEGDEDITGLWPPADCASQPSSGKGGYHGITYCKCRPARGLGGPPCWPRFAEVASEETLKPNPCRTLRLRQLQHIGCPWCSEEGAAALAGSPRAVVGCSGGATS